MENKLCFVAVEFADDPNVAGYTYWYLCAFDEVKIGDVVYAPLGRHNNVQSGIVRMVKFEEESNAPFPLHYIKNVRKIAERN